ncbi:MAG: hypothetical protein WCY11_18860 [Novosphingobium sp.]
MSEIASVLMFKVQAREDDMLRYDSGPLWVDVAALAIVVLIVWTAIEHMETVKSFLASWGVPVS